METTTLFCKHCNKEQAVQIEVKANNHVAYCTGCGSYVKNIPHSSQDVEFYVGKYKGTKVRECSDLSYLQWFRLNVKMSERMAEEVSMRISTLEFNYK